MDRSEEDSESDEVISKSGLTKSLYKRHVTVAYYNDKLASLLKRGALRDLSTVSCISCLLCVISCVILSYCLFCTSLKQYFMQLW